MGTVGKRKTFNSSHRRNPKSIQVECGHGWRTWWTGRTLNRGLSNRQFSLSRKIMGSAIEIQGWILDVKRKEDETVTSQTRSGPRAGVALLHYQFTDCWFFTFCLL